MATVNLVMGLVLLGSCEDAHRPGCKWEAPHVHMGVTWSSNNHAVFSRAMVIRLLQMLRVGKCIKSEDALHAEEQVRRNEVECLQSLAEDYTEKEIKKLAALGDDGRRDPSTMNPEMTRIYMDSLVFFTA